MMKELHKMSRTSNLTTHEIADKYNELVEAMKELQEMTFNYSADKLYDFVTPKLTREQVTDMSEKRYTIAELREKFERWKEETPQNYIIKHPGNIAGLFLDWLEQEDSNE